MSLVCLLTDFHAGAGFMFSQTIKTGVIDCIYCSVYRFEVLLFCYFTHNSF